MNASAEHILKHGHGPIGYMVLARETAYYQCLNSDDKPCCDTKHRTVSGMYRCKNGTRTAVRTNAGDLIAVKKHYLNASNGENAKLVYPVRQIEEVK